ncbi:MAG: 2-phosphosulfolactate phosphatase [Thermodesulfobacteriota bacterium]
MEFKRADLSNCHQAGGTVVVIDVLRAFTTACYAFAAGVEEIVLASGIEEAFQLRDRLPDARIVGEQGGLPVEGFDFSNSPSEIKDAPLEGQQLILRTSAGTKGVLSSRNAERILVSSLCCAGATARELYKKSPRVVTFVETGVFPEDNRGDEDRVCADYIQSLLLDESLDNATILSRVKNSVAAQPFMDLNKPDFPLSDLELSLKINAFDFVLEVKNKQGLLLINSL